MAKFDSPLGSKQVSGTVMKEFNVPDESGFSPPMPQQVRQRHNDIPVFDENDMRDFESRMSPPPRNVQMREISEGERQILEAKKAKREGKERLSDGAKRRIEILLGMTRLTKDIDIGGNLYRIRTLTSRELREALLATSAFEGNAIGYVFESRKQVLGRSLMVVAGVEINQFVGSNYLEDHLEFIEDMDHSVLIRLYNEYNALAQEAQDKYSPKTEEEVKEVLEDLKK